MKYETSNLQNKNKLKESTENILDNNSSTDNLKLLPKYIEQINQNINNIDSKINTIEHSNRIKSSNNTNRNNNAAQECFDIKNIVKQSVEGLNDIFNSKMGKNQNKISSSKGFDTTFEENSQNKINLKKDKSSNQVNLNLSANITPSQITSNISQAAKKVKITNNSNINNTNNSKREIKNLKSKLNYENNANNADLSQNTSVNLSGMTSNVKATYGTLGHKLKTGQGSAGTKNEPATGTINLNVDNKTPHRSPLLKEKMVNKTFFKDKDKDKDTPNSFQKAEKVDKNDSDVTNFVITNDKNKISSNKVSHNQVINRRKSANDRYDNDISERENSHKHKSKSPMPNKNFAFKPKIKKENMDASNVSANPNSNRNKTGQYASEHKVMLNKKPSKKNLNNNNNQVKQSFVDVRKNISSNKPQEGSTNSHRKSSNYVNFIRNQRNSVDDDYTLDPFIKMLFLFNEVNQSKIKDDENKLQSENLSKILLGLVEEKKANQITNEEENAIPNEKLYDIIKIIKIQRKWRFIKISKTLKLSDKNNFTDELKSDLFHSIHSQDTILKISNLLNSALKLFNSLSKDNKNAVDMIGDYITLNSSKSILDSQKQNIYKRFITQKLKTKNQFNKIEEDKPIEKKAPLTERSYEEKDIPIKPLNVPAEPDKNENTEIIENKQENEEDEVNEKL